MTLARAVEAYRKAEAAERASERAKMQLRRRVSLLHSSQLAEYARLTIEKD